MYYHILHNPQPYEPVLILQEKLRNDVLNNKLNNGVILFLEHTPVYTLGIRGKKDNLLADADFIRREKIEIHKIRRGGDITYHGPGQLIIYPILHIKKLGFASIKSFVEWWNALISEVLHQHYNISACFDESRPGLWVDNKKLMAVGLHFRHFVPIHGFALNIDPDKNHFHGINPCGLGSEITSIRDISGKSPAIQTLSREILSKVEQKLSLSIKELTL